MTTIAWILLAYIGFSALFCLFVLFFGDKGTFFNVTSSAPGGSPAPSSPITTFPTTLLGGTPPQTLGGNIDVPITTLGMVFLEGGMVAVILLAIMLFFAPQMLISKCTACNICHEGCEPQPSYGGCAAPMSPGVFNKAQ